ncbi:Uncharacterised protein [Candidatus Gugararchaeum adminiculabundum]|nr:Uncharacterised protein [Candidatus Gugararchaeum adminiculabundum]
MIAGGNHSTSGKTESPLDPRAQIYQRFYKAVFTEKTITLEALAQRFGSLVTEQLRWMKKTADAYETLLNSEKAKSGFGPTPQTCFGLFMREYSKEWPEKTGPDWSPSAHGVAVDRVCREILYSRGGNNVLAHIRKLFHNRQYSDLKNWYEKRRPIEYKTFGEEYKLMLEQNTKFNEAVGRAFSQIMLSALEQKQMRDLLLVSLQKLLKKPLSAVSWTDLNGLIGPDLEKLELVRNDPFYPQAKRVLLQNLAKILQSQDSIFDFFKMHKGSLSCADALGVELNASILDQLKQEFERFFSKSGQFPCEPNPRKSVSDNIDAAIAALETQLSASPDLSTIIETVSQFASGEIASSSATEEAMRKFAAETSIQANPENELIERKIKWLHNWERDFEIRHS